MRCAWLVLATACAPTGALAIGPTIDSDHVVRLEGNGDVGPVLGGNNVPEVADPTQRSFGVWAAGIRIALGAGMRVSDAQGWFGGYLEYLQLGTPGAPWGFHAGITIAGTFASHAQPVIGLDIGIDHLAHAHSEDTGDGFATTFVTDGLDVTVRGHGDHWWQVGAQYMRRGTLLYE